MSNKKLDRRIIRTRRQLADAMLALLLERDYDALTIYDITERADLNRATFYLHYGSKDELLIAALEARFDELVAQIESVLPQDAPWDDTRDVLMVYEHVAAYAPLYRVLLGEQGRAYVINRVIDYITDVNMRFCEAAFGPVVHEDPRLMLATRHMAGSLHALLTWWLRADMPYSAAEMTEMTHALHTHGLSPLIDAFDPS